MCLVIRKYEFSQWSKIYLRLAATCRQERRLVDEVCQVSTSEAGGTGCHVSNIDTRRHGNIAQVEAQNGLAAPLVRR